MKYLELLGVLMLRQISVNNNHDDDLHSMMQVSANLG